MTAAQRAFAGEHLGLAQQQAHRFARRWSMQVDDLVGPVYEGLCKGTIGFDLLHARRPVAVGLSDEQIAEQLGVPLPLWLDCRRACGQRPVPLQEE